jgi:dihydropteroate synthase
MGKLLGAEVSARVAPALACTALAVAAGVQIVRTHDVVETAQAIRMAEAILAKQKA